MHIPDGYLSPLSAGTLFGMVIPFWYAAANKVKKLLATRAIPTMALLSAFCFVIQMLNIPLPGGTTGHAVGATLAAVLLGPWPAVISVTISVVIQTLFFGDGGITTIGANCFNMAVIQVFSAYYIYSTISSGIPTIRRRIFAASIAGYLSSIIAALFAALELGIQPLLATSPEGLPLYAPYSLKVTIPAMLIGHLVAGIAEAVVAGAAVAYLHRSLPELLIPPSIESVPSPAKKTRVLWAGIGLLIILTPFGLLASGTAWGEWSSQQLKDLGLGFIPSGMHRFENLWRGLLPDYSFPGMNENVGYILAALSGVVIIGFLYFLIYSLLRKFLKQAPQQSFTPDHQQSLP